MVLSLVSLYTLFWHVPSMVVATLADALMSFSLYVCLSAGLMT